MGKIVEDAASFTDYILRNPNMPPEEIEVVRGVLTDQLRERWAAADADGRSGKLRDAYFFFQGALMGMVIAFKQVKTHYENTGWEQGVNPATGEKIKDHGNS